MRNKARRVVAKAGLVKKGDSKDVDHKDGNAMNNKRSNLAVKSASSNRSYPRTKSAGKKKLKGIHNDLKVNKGLLRKY